MLSENFESKIAIIFLPISLNNVLDAQKNCPTFKYQQCMFGPRNKNDKVQVHTLICGHDF